MYDRKHREVAERQRQIGEQLQDSHEADSEFKMALSGLLSPASKKADLSKLPLAVTPVSREMAPKMTKVSLPRAGPSSGYCRKTTLSASRPRGTGHLVQKGAAGLLLAFRG